MCALPDSEIYEQELLYMPYRDSLKKVLSYLVEHAPKNGTLLDLMCGPGYLLAEIVKKRPDLHVKGVDIDERYIPHAQEKYPHIEFEQGDVLVWKPKEKYDVVICTGSLHHIAYEQQALAVERMASMVKPEGFVLISDCCIDDYSTEKERKLVAAKLGYEYLRETIQNGAPVSVIAATNAILGDDVLMKEFKTSMKKRNPVFETFFGNIETFKTWPLFESEYGDYISVCRKVKSV